MIRQACSRVSGRAKRGPRLAPVATSRNCRCSNAVPKRARARPASSDPARCRGCAAPAVHAHTSDCTEAGLTLAAGTSSASAVEAPARDRDAAAAATAATAARRGDHRAEPSERPDQEASAVLAQTNGRRMDDSKHGTVEEAAAPRRSSAAPPAPAAPTAREANEIMMTTGMSRMWDFEPSVRTPHEKRGGTAG